MRDYLTTQTSNAINELFSDCFTVFWTIHMKIIKMNSPEGFTSLHHRCCESISESKSWEFYSQREHLEIY